MQEFQIIDKYFKPLTINSKAANGLLDDVAKISLKKDEELIISKDLFIEDVHFLKKDGGFKIASKLLRANLSDIASSGAKPIYYMLGFSKNKNLDKKFIEEFSLGLKSVQDEFDLCLIGGDTVSSEKLFFSITIFGIAKKGKILSRIQAKNGDLIFTSGFIGDAYLGLKTALSKKSLNKLNQDEKYLLERHFFPTARISLGQNLIKNNLSSCAIDVSDGLLSDLRHICRSSKLDADLYLDQIPISDSAKKILKNNDKINILDLISGGDDYELIFSANSKNREKIFSLAKKLKINISEIGVFHKSLKKNFEINLFKEKNNLSKIKIKKFGYEH